MYKTFKTLSVAMLCVLSAIWAFTFTYSYFSVSKFNISDDNIALEKPLPNSVIKTVETREEESEEALEAFTGEEKISEDTNIVYEYYFIADGKTKKAEQKAPHPFINLSRKQLLEKIEGWRVMSFSSKEVVLRKIIEATSTGTYILGIWNDHVAVFHGGQTIGTGLMEITDTPVSTLSHDEYERLTEGIIIENEQELMKVLEDYGS